jgi:type IV pilus assembly protein PilM
MVREALEQFLSRNDVRGDKVAISVAGQSGLSRFFKPPPVPVRTLRDVVKYEVKQQIPFPIEEVIWDWQQLGGTVVDDRIVDAEIGLFAMKREAVFRALKPFDDVGVEVDIVQLSPLAVFNYVANDVLESTSAVEEIDPENPPESVVVISMGTDTTDLVVTNGIKLWLRNIPVGGNHFTRQLSRELKLTHAKAEQLKRNARQAEDPKQLFKAMRPVFGDFVSEVQRSLAFFQGLEKNAKVSRLVLLGNSANLPGLRQFLNQQLELDIVKVSDFQHLSGSEVLNEKSFQENSLSFAPAYGLCLQALNKARLKTNLLPVEIRLERIIRAKKPWILASLSLLMLGMMAGYYFKQSARFSAADDFRGSDGDVTWKQATDEGQTKVSLSRQLVQTDKEQKARLLYVNRLSNELASSADKKATWVEFTSALTQALPRDPRISGSDPVDANEIPYDTRTILYIDEMETIFDSDIAVWQDSIKPIYDAQFEADLEKLAQSSASAPVQPATPGASPATPGASSFLQQQAQASQPVIVSKSGYRVELRGHHYHNSEKDEIEGNSGKSFLLRTLIDKLVNGEMELPGTAEEGGGKFKFSDFGILTPTIVRRSGMPEDYTINLTDLENPNAAEVVGGRGDRKENSGDGRPDGGAGQGGRGEQGAPAGEGRDAAPDSGDDKKNQFSVKRFNFVVQMAWIPRTPAERIRARAERIEREKTAASAKPAAPAGGGAVSPAGSVPAPGASPAPPAAGDDND